ncbi:hypothetical protein HMPREF9062_2222 [Actinomyces sp. oral taxon 448 str. F0400]|nr:hypothetical protein HMPREF9062_2222 [Actinomyces sp. oral taxon 448 str. F0400]
MARPGRLGRTRWCVCVVYLIRASMRFVAHPWRESRHMLLAL